MDHAIILENRAREIRASGTQDIKEIMTSRLNYYSDEYHPCNKQLEKGSIEWEFPETRECPKKLICHSICEISLKPERAILSRVEIFSLGKEKHFVAKAQFKTIF